MEITPYVRALQDELVAVASLGDEQTAAAAHRIAAALEAPLSLRLLEAFGEAALELSAQLHDGHVEVRLAGRDPALIYVAERAASEPSTGSDDPHTSRVTLRLSDTLKAAVEAAAGAEGISTNSWLVAAVKRGLAAGSNTGRRKGGARRITGFADS